MISLFQSASYKNLNKVTVSRSALLANHHALQNSQRNTLVCPVLKSNAYGHGLREVAPIFDQMHCPFLVVDSLYEAYELYKLKVQTPILIMGYTDPHNFMQKRLPFHIAIYDIELAKALNQYQPGCNIHIFVDTGMRREGIPLQELSSFLTQIKPLKNLHIVGLCSHFADADNPHTQTFTNKQLKQYKDALSIVSQHGFNPQWRHISASAGTYTVYDDTFTMIRAGLSHYGISPFETGNTIQKKIILQPALEFVSTIVQIKKIPKGSKIGYNGTYTTPTSMTLGLIPAGYYEGVDRRLSNTGFMKIRDQFFPIVGRVSMNMTTIDITTLKNPTVGEPVVIYSSQNADQNSISHAAKVCKTIPYELLVHIAESVKRVVIQ